MFRAWKIWSLHKFLLGLHGCHGCCESQACWTGSMSGNGPPWWISTELQTHLHAGACAAVIHRKTQRRRCRFNASLWWAEGRHLPRGSSLLNMNFFEYLLGILWIWVMKFMFATVQIVTSMVSGDGLVDVEPVAETRNLIQNMLFCWI